MKLSKTISINLKKIHDLRYGENPHQEGALFVENGQSAGFEKLWGIDLSYNNLEDAHSAWGLVCEFSKPTIAIIKHGNPSGIAVRKNPVEAFNLSYKADNVSAYGGIVATNTMPTIELIEAMSGKFFELMIAPNYSKQVLLRLKKRSAKMRVIKANKPIHNFEVKRVFNGFLVQTPDEISEPANNWKVACGRKPDEKTLGDCKFAVKIVKHVKSNAIVIAKDLNMLGVGIGQPNRVNSVALAVKQAGGRAKGAVLASDAFFPFDDSVKAAAKAGISTIVQPGGSIRDEGVINTAKKLGITMVFTGVRHFRH